MPGIVRVGDLCSGHGCYPPRPAIEGSPNVFMNGRAIVREGVDNFAVHCKYCGKKPNCHQSVVTKASSNVFANGIEIARVGDPIGCGSACAQGSTDGFGGG